MFPLRKGLAQRRLSLLMALVILLMGAFTFTPALHTAYAAEALVAGGGGGGGGGGGVPLSPPDGTSGNPFVITTADQLAGFASAVNASVYSEAFYFRLGNDIDLSGYSGGSGWTPIGTESNPFQSHFDGAGHTISGLSINTNDGYVGLFGYIIGSTAEVKNLNVSVTGIAGGFCVGGVAGYVYGSSVTNCSVTGTGSVSGVFTVGGVVGSIGEGSVVKYCYATSAVNGTDFFVGGVAGYVDSGSVMGYCYATGTVSGDSSFVGGVAGWVDYDAASLTGCYSTGAVSGAAGVGGVTGEIAGGNMSGCYATGPVSSTGFSFPGLGYVSFVGGVAGEVAGGSTSGCYATGPVTGAGDYVGGLVGNVYAGSVANCYSTGTVNGAGYYVGGVAGAVLSNNGSDGLPAGSAQLTNCYAAGPVSGGDTVGGVAGLVRSIDGYSATVQNCAALNPSVTWHGVSGNADPPSIGRVVGSNDGGTLSGNVAFSGMTSSGASFPTPAATYNVGSGLNGADITAEKIRSDGTIGGRFNVPVWTVANNGLPGFGQTVGMPGHLALIGPGGNTGGGSSSTGGGGGGSSKYKVTFVTNGGSTISSQSVAYKAKVTKPADPTKDGFTFAGWYSDKELTVAFDFTKGITGNTTIYAKWTAGAPTPFVPTPTPNPTPTPGQPSSGWQNPFNDVKSTDWFYSDVEYVVANGIFNGTGATTFSPNSSMTRGMFVTVLWRAAGSPAAGGGKHFTDVQPDAYYAQAVRWAAANDIVKGVSSTKFAPNGLVTREQMAALLYRYEQFSGQIPSAAGAAKNFADQGKISGYAKDSVNALVKQGILSGKPNNLFDPQGTAMRAEVAAMLHRFATAVR